MLKQLSKESAKNILDNSNYKESDIINGYNGLFYDTDKNCFLCRLKNCIESVDITIKL